MSGVAKGVKKVFKTVGKVAKKVLPYALPAAAVLFTAGAALGLTPSFGAMAGGLVGKLGLGSTLSSVLTGAVTHAGFGGAIGAGIGGITGGKKGALRGSLLGQAAGAVTGGVTGYMNAPGLAGAASNQTGISQAAGANAPRDVSASTRAMTGMSMSGDGYLPGQTGASSFTPSTGVSYSPQGMPAGIAQSQAAHGLTSSVQGLPSSSMVGGGGGIAGAAGAAGGGFRSLDPLVQASMVTALGAGLPQAIGALTSSDEEENHQLAVEEARRKAIAGNYTTNVGNYQPTFSTGTPTQRVIAYRYDPSQGRIVPQYG